MSKRIETLSQHLSGRLKTQEQEEQGKEEGWRTGTRRGDHCPALQLSPTSQSTQQPASTPAPSAASQTQPATAVDASIETVMSYSEAPHGVRESALDIPLVKDEKKEMSSDPVGFLMRMKQLYPDMFMVERSKNNKFVVVSDELLFEDILTYDDIFGNPVTPNMSVNKTVFQIPVEQLERHEQPVISKLRRHLINHNATLADGIADRLNKYLDQVLGEKGEMDLRDLGTAVFWPMTQALFGDDASMEKAPYLKKAFDDIDNSFGKALKGKEVPEVKQGVETAYKTFKDIFQRSNSSSKEDGGTASACPMGPLMKFYDDATGHEDPNLTAKLSTAGWWGGQGNTLPSTVWAFGQVLADSRVKDLVYREIDGPFASEPDSEGHYDYNKLEYTTAVLKEALRLKTFSIAWRFTQKDALLTSPKTKKTYKVPKHTLLGLHFAMRHMDPEVYDEPSAFQPERFLGSGSGLSPHINGHRYAWVPFSAGRHKCAGYSLAMLEIPVVMALVFRKYNMELLDPLPGMDFQQAFGVVSPDSQPVRVRYAKRG